MKVKKVVNFNNSAFFAEIKSVKHIRHLKFSYLTHHEFFFCFGQFGVFLISSVFGFLYSILYSFWYEVNSVFRHFWTLICIVFSFLRQNAFPNYPNTYILVIWFKSYDGLKTYQNFFCCIFKIFINLQQKIVKRNWVYRMSKNYP
jgi:hypothetical protein